MYSLDLISQILLHSTLPFSFSLLLPTPECPRSSGLQMVLVGRVWSKPDTMSPNKISDFTENLMLKIENLLCLYPGHVNPFKEHLLSKGPLPGDISYKGLP